MRTMTMRSKAGWGVMMFLVVALVLSSVRYFMTPEAYFPRQQLTYEAKQFFILSHIAFMMVGVLMGPFQFLRSFREKHRGTHRTMGKVYLVASTIGATFGLYMSFYSASDAWSGVAFGLLALGVLSTNYMAYTAIRRRDITQHREWMTRSFAFMLAAVTLRIYLFPLEAAFGEYTGYAIVAWASWVPNVIVAEWVIRKQRRGGTEPRLGAAVATA